MSVLMADIIIRRTCGHCRQPMRGYASHNNIWLCHPDEGLDCYRLVTVFAHPVPCFQCASTLNDEEVEMLDRYEIVNLENLFSARELHKAALLAGLTAEVSTKRACAAYLVSVGWTPSRVREALVVK